MSDDAVPYHQIARLIHVPAERDAALRSMIARTRDLQDAAEKLLTASDPNDIEDAMFLFDALSRLVPVEIERTRAVLETSPTIRPRSTTTKRTPRR